VLNTQRITFPSIIGVRHHSESLNLKPERSAEPSWRRVVSYVEVQHLAPTMFQDDEFKQHFHGGCRYLGKVHGHRLAEVIVQKHPGLGRRTAEGPEDARYTTRGNRDFELCKFAMNPRRTPHGFVATISSSKRRISGLPRRGDNVSTGAPQNWRKSSRRQRTTMSG
jgi:hypothetical protein